MSGNSMNTDNATRRQAAAAPEYLSGFGNEHSSEALAGALPVGQFSPQRCPYGLYAEKFSTTAFTAPRATNRRTWFYRIRPSVVQGEFELLDARLVRTGYAADAAMPPDQLRWDPFAIPAAPRDFVDGLVTLAANGDAHGQAGIGIHMYLANRSMESRFFYCADGEFLLLPQQGRIRLHTECGMLDCEPGEIAVVPRGMKFRVVLRDGASRGYVCENYGAPLQLPERGPVGSDGYANDRDFLAPVAAFEERDGDFQLVCKFAGRLYSAPLAHSPWTSWPGSATRSRTSTICAGSMH